MGDYVIRNEEGDANKSFAVFNGKGFGALLITEYSFKTQIL